MRTARLWAAMCVIAVGLTAQARADLLFFFSASLTPVEGSTAQGTLAVRSDRTFDETVDGGDEVDGSVEFELLLSGLTPGNVYGFNVGPSELRWDVLKQPDVPGAFTYDPDLVGSDDSTWQLTADEQGRLSAHIRLNIDALTSRGLNFVFPESGDAVALVDMGEGISPPPGEGVVATGTLSAVPEPASVLLLAALAGIALAGRHRWAVARD